MYLLMFYIMLPFMFGGITYMMCLAKGRKHGFWWGFTLLLLGVIIVGMMGDKQNCNQCQK